MVRARIEGLLDEPRLLPLSISAASLGALAAAYISQYGFGLLPCILCLYQRIPYALAAILCSAAVMVGPRLRVALVALAGVALVVNSGIAVFHVGVEQHWWTGTAECVGQAGDLAAGDLLAQLSKPAGLPRCDEPAWKLFGITMAGYNVVLALGLGLVALAGAFRQWRRSDRSEAAV